MSFVIVNGHVIKQAAASLSIYDRGLTLGHGLFETGFMINSHIPLFDYHWQRLCFSAKLLEIKLPFKKDSLLAHLKTLALANGVNKSTGFRITLTDGNSERGLLKTQNSHSNFFITLFPKPQIAHFATLTIVKTRRNEKSLSSRIKSISYLDNILAKQEASRKGFDEALLLNHQGRVCEGATSNIFIVKNNTLMTPAIKEGALPGVMRAYILDTYKDMAIVVTKITQEMLMTADECFISNALMGVRSVKVIDKQTFALGPITQSVMQMLNLPTPSKNTS